MWIGVLTGVGTVALAHTAPHVLALHSASRREMLLRRPVLARRHNESIE